MNRTGVGLAGANGAGWLVGHRGRPKPRGNKWEETCQGTELDSECNDMKRGRVLMARWVFSKRPLQLQVEDRQARGKFRATETYGRILSPSSLALG